MQDNLFSYKLLYCKSLAAWTGVFNGTTSYQATFQPQRKYHVNDISFRFKTMSSDGVIFQTRSKTDRGFMRAELEDGRVKITTNLGGQNQVFKSGLSGHFM